jgi:hypothetical protein
MSKGHRKRRSQHIPKSAIPLYSFNLTLAIPLFMDDTCIMLTYIEPCMYVCELDMNILVPIGIVHFTDGNMSIDNFNHSLANMDETGVNASQLDRIPEALFYLLRNWAAGRRKLNDLRMEVQDFDTVIFTTRDIYEDAKKDKDRKVHHRKGDVVILKGGLYSVSDNGVLLYLGCIDTTKLRMRGREYMNDIAKMIGLGVTGTTPKIIDWMKKP